MWITRWRWPHTISRVVCGRWWWIWVYHWCWRRRIIRIRRRVSRGCCARWGSNYHLLLIWWRWGITAWIRRISIKLLRIILWWRWTISSVITSRWWRVGTRFMVKVTRRIAWRSRVANLLMVMVLRWSRIL